MLDIDLLWFVWCRDLVFFVCFCLFLCLSNQLVEASQPGRTHLKSNPAKCSWFRKRKKSKQV